MHQADEDEAEGRNRKERMISVTAVTAATVLRIPDRYRKTVTAVTTVTEEGQMQKNVQISYELFIDLIRFHLFGFDENEAKIRMDLKRKLNTMCDMNSVKASMWRTQRLPSTCLILLMTATVIMKDCSQPL